MYLVKLFSFGYNFEIVPFETLRLQTFLQKYSTSMHLHTCIDSKCDRLDFTACLTTRTNVIPFVSIKIIPFFF